MYACPLLLPSASHARWPLSRPLSLSGGFSPTPTLYSKPFHLVIIFFGCVCVWLQRTNNTVRARLQGLDASKSLEAAIAAGIFPASSPRCGVVCDWRCYLENNVDLARAFGATNVAAAQQHYWTHGKTEGRSCMCKGEFNTNNGTSASYTYAHQLQHQHRTTLIPPRFREEMAKDFV